MLMRVLRALAATATALLLAAAPAFAVTHRYCSTGGSASYAASTNSGTPMSLTTANANAQSGDVIHLAAGSYGTLISPANSGSAPTGSPAVSNNIVFIGNPASPGGTTVTSIDLQKNYCTVKGVTSTGIARIGPVHNSSGAQPPSANRDSISSCVLSGGVEFQGAKDSFIGHSTVTGHGEFACQGGIAIHDPANPIQYVACERDTLRDCAWDGGTIQEPNHTWKMRCYTQYCVVDSIRFSAAYQSTAGGGAAVGRILYNSYHNLLRDNSWTIEAYAQSAGGTWNGFVYRDSSSFNKMLRDTCLFGMNSSASNIIIGQLTGAGTYGQTVTDTFSYCVYKTNGRWYAQNHLKNTVFDHCVLATTSSSTSQWLLDVNEFSGTLACTGNTITYNTFVSAGTALYIQANNNANNDISKNIFYSTGTVTPSSGGGVTKQATSSSSGTTRDYNLYWNPTFDTNAGDRSIVWGSTNRARPGFNTTSDEQTWFTSNGFDQHSRHASPLFQDSSIATLNARLRAGSPALTLGPGGTEVGAFAGEAPDTCLDADRPGRVSDLVAVYDPTGPGKVVLQFTVPSDNQFTAGTQTSRIYATYSATPVTNDAQFWAAFAAGQEITISHNRDGYQLFDMGSVGQHITNGHGIDNVVNMNGVDLRGQTLYITMKFNDLDVGNLWSCVSNSASVAIPAADPCLSAAIPNRPVGTVFRYGAGSILVDMPLVPCAQQGTGDPFASHIIIRRSASPITDANFASATLVYDQLVENAAQPDGLCSDVLSGWVVEAAPAAGLWYLAARGESGGQVGCIAADTVSIPSLPAIPSTITSLFVSSPLNGIVTCTWTAPGGDGSSGTALEYDFRWSWRGPLTSATFNDTLHDGSSSAQGGTYFLRYPVADWPAPQVAGTQQSISFAAREGQVVWVIGRARGPAGWSLLSNGDSTIVRKRADLGNFPRTFVYGVSGPRNPPGQTYYKAWPYLYFDGLTVNYTYLNRILNHPFVVLNQEVAVSDSFDAICRYRDANFPNTVFLFGVTTDPSFTFFGDSTSNTACCRWPRMMYSRVGDALRNVEGRGWPAQFAIPYSSGYNTHGLSYVSGADTLSPSPFLFCRGLGWKGTLYGSIKSATVASAGETFSGINYGYRDAIGRFLVADTMAKVVEEVGYDRMYTKVDGTQARVHGGAQFDLSAADLLTPKVNVSIGDYPDWRRAGVAPFNYPDSVSFLAGWVEGKQRFYRRLRELTPEWGWIGINGGTQASFDYAGGSMREGYPVQQGGTVQTNLLWKPGGGVHDELRFSHGPGANTLFSFPSQQTVSDSNMATGFNPDTAFARADYEFGMASACLIGAYFNYGPAAAAVMNAWSHAALAYPAWDFDERFVDYTTGQCYSGTRYDLAGWGGSPTSDMYAHYPGATNRVFFEDFENGANPDSQAWNQSAGANGYTHVVPDPDGSGFVMRVRPAKLFGPNYDYFFSSISLGKLLTTSTDDYTISGEIQADSARWVSILLLKNDGTPWPANSFANTRVFAMPSKLPFAIRMPSPGSAPDSVRVAIFAGDTLNSFLIDNIQVHKGDSTLYIRDFKSMTVLVNPGGNARSHTFPMSKRRLTARTGIWRNTNNGESGPTITVPATSGVFLVAAAGAQPPEPPTTQPSLRGAPGRRWHARRRR